MRAATLNQKPSSSIQAPSVSSSPRLLNLSAKKADTSCCSSSLAKKVTPPSSGGLFFSGLSSSPSLQTHHSSNIIHESTAMKAVRLGAESALNAAASRRAHLERAGELAGSGEGDPVVELKGSLDAAIGPALPAPDPPVEGLRSVKQQDAVSFSQADGPIDYPAWRTVVPVRSAVQALLHNHTTQKDRLTTSFSLEHALIAPILDGVKSAVLEAESKMVEEAGMGAGGLHVTATAVRGSLVVPYTWFDEAHRVVESAISRTIAKEAHRYHQPKSHKSGSEEEQRIMSGMEREVVEAATKGAAHAVRVASAAAILTRMLEQVRDAVPGMGTALELFQRIILPEVYQGFEGHAAERSSTLSSLAHHIGFFAQINPPGKSNMHMAGGEGECEGSEGDPVTSTEADRISKRGKTVVKLLNEGRRIPQTGMALRSVEQRFTSYLNGLLHVERTYLRTAMENWGFAIWRGNKRGAKRRALVLDRLSEILFRGPVLQAKRRVMASWKLYVTQRRLKKLLATTCVAFDAYLKTSANEGAEDAMVVRMAKRAIRSGAEQAEAHRYKLMLECEGGNMPIPPPPLRPPISSAVPSSSRNQKWGETKNSNQGEEDEEIDLSPSSSIHSWDPEDADDVAASTKNLASTLTSHNHSLPPHQQRTKRATRVPDSQLGAEASSVTPRSSNNISLLTSLCGVMLRKIQQLDGVGGSLRHQSSHQVSTLRSFEHEAHGLRQKNRRLEQQLLETINEKLALQNLLQEKDIELLDLERRVNRLRSKTKLQMHQPWRAIGFKVLREMCEVVSGVPGTNDHLLLGASSITTTVVASGVSGAETAPSPSSTLTSRDLNAEHDKKEREENGGRMGVAGDAGHPAAGIDPAFLPTDEELAFGRLAPLVVLSTCGTARQLIAKKGGIRGDVGPSRNSLGSSAHDTSGSRTQSVVDPTCPIAMPDPLVILRDWVNACLDALHSLDGRGGGSGIHSRRATELGTEMADGMILSRLLFYLSLPRYRYQSVDEEDVASNTPIDEDDFEANRQRLLERDCVRLCPPVPSYPSAFDDLRQGAAYQRAELLIGFASDLLEGRHTLERLRDARRAHMDAQFEKAAAEHAKHLEEEEMQRVAAELAAASPTNLSRYGSATSNTMALSPAASVLRSAMLGSRAAASFRAGAASSPPLTRFQSTLTSPTAHNRSMSPNYGITSVERNSSPPPTASSSRVPPKQVFHTTAEDALDIRDLLPPKPSNAASTSIDLYVKFRAGEVPNPRAGGGVPRFGDGSPFPMPTRGATTATGSPQGLGASATTINPHDWALQLLHDNAAGTLPNLRDSIDPNLLSTGCRVTVVTLLAVLYLKYAHPFCHKTSQDAQEEQELLRSLVEEALESRVKVERTVDSRDASLIATARSALEEKNKAELREVEFSLGNTKGRFASGSGQEASSPRSVNGAAASPSPTSSHRVVTEGRGNTQRSVEELFKALQSFATVDKSPWQVLFEQLRPLVSGCEATHLFLLKGNFWDPKAIDSCDTFEVFSRVILALNESLRRHKWHILTTCLINTSGGGVGGGDRAALSGVLGSPVTFLMERRNEGMHRVAKAAQNGSLPCVDADGVLKGAGGGGGGTHYVSEVGGDMCESVILGDSFGALPRQGSGVGTGPLGRPIAKQGTSVRGASTLKSPLSLSTGSGAGDSWRSVQVAAPRPNGPPYLAGSLRIKSEVAMETPFNIASSASSLHLDPRAAATVLLQRGDVALPSFRPVVVEKNNKSGTSVVAFPHTQGPSTTNPSLSLSLPTSQQQSPPSPQLATAVSEATLPPAGLVEPLQGQVTLNDYASLSVSIGEIHMAIAKDASSWVELFLSRCMPKSKVERHPLHQQQGGGTQSRSAFEGVGGASVVFGGSSSTSNFTWNLLAWRQFWREIGLNVAMVDEELLADVFYSATRRGRTGIAELVVAVPPLSNHCGTPVSRQRPPGTKEVPSVSVPANVGGGVLEGKVFVSNVWPETPAATASTELLTISLLPVYNWSSYLSAGNASIEVQQMLREVSGVGPASRGPSDTPSRSADVSRTPSGAMAFLGGGSLRGESKRPKSSMGETVPVGMLSVPGAHSTSPSGRQRGSSRKSAVAPTIETAPSLSPETESALRKFALHSSLLPSVEILPTGEVMFTHPDYFGCKLGVGGAARNLLARGVSQQGTIPLDSFVSYQLACHSQQSELMHRETQELDFDEWLEAVTRLLGHIVPYTVTAREIQCDSGDEGLSQRQVEEHSSPLQPSQARSSSASLLFSSNLHNAIPPLPARPDSDGAATVFVAGTLRPFLNGIDDYCTTLLGRLPSPSQAGKDVANWASPHSPAPSSSASQTRMWWVAGGATKCDFDTAAPSHSVSILPLGMALQWFIRSKAKPQTMYLDHPFTPKLRLGALLAGAYVQEVLRYHGSALSVVFNHFGAYRGPTGNAILIANRRGASSGKGRRQAGGMPVVPSGRRRGGDVSALLSEASPTSGAAASTPAALFHQSPLIVDCELQPTTTTMDLVDFLAFVRECDGLLIGSGGGSQSEGGYLHATELYRTLARDIPAHSRPISNIDDTKPSNLTTTSPQGPSPARNPTTGVLDASLSPTTTDKPHRLVASHVSADALGKTVFLTLEGFVIAIAAMAATRYPNVLRPFHMRLHEFIVRCIETPLQSRISSLMATLKARRGQAASAMAVAVQAESL